MPAKRVKRKKYLTATQQRKKQHLSYSLDTNAVSYPYGSGFDGYTFLHNALPELDMDESDTTARFWGGCVRAPLLISSMTGGFGLARKVNWNLAIAAQELGLAMGVGSQRVALEEPSVAESFQVREVAPDIFLFANLGAVQLNYGYGIDQCRRAVSMIQADALILHLNVLQEATQPEGDRNFKGLTNKIAQICRQLEVPVLVKEVGTGISDEVALRLQDAGVRAIDVAGTGGTSWYAVEARRAAKKGQFPEKTFANWGIPTDESLKMVRRAVPDLELVASGGIRNGLDVGKAVALGANLCGIGQPLLEPALNSAGRVVETISKIIYEIKLTMLCAGARNLEALRQVPLIRRHAASAWEILRN